MREAERDNHETFDGGRAPGNTLRSSAPPSVAFNNHASEEHASTVTYRETVAKSILRKYKRIDSWFCTRYGMNLYRGCVHDCAYCDGRSETYQVEGAFGRDIEIKTNALEILRREIDPARRRKPLTRCFFMIGSGVTDAYQPIERRRRFTRRALELFRTFGYPASLLTKSPLILDDIDLIAALHRETGAVVGVSISSVDPAISRTFEPSVAPPERRLAILSACAERGIPCAMFLMPIIPFVSDREDQIEAALSAAKSAGANYVLASGMTLKPGRQKEHFLHTAARFHAERSRAGSHERRRDRGDEPALDRRIAGLYADEHPWGGPDQRYAADLDMRIGRAARVVRIPLRMPARIFAPILSDHDRVVVILDHLEYLQRLKGVDSHYGAAAHSIGMISDDIHAVLSRLTDLRGVGPYTQKLVQETLDRGTPRLYDDLMAEYL